MFEKWLLQFITEENIDNIWRKVDISGFQKKHMIWSSSFLYWSKQSNTAKLIRDNNLLATKVDSFFRTEFAADSKKNGWHKSGAEGAFRRCKNVPICTNLTVHVSKWPPQGSRESFWNFFPPRPYIRFRNRAKRNFHGAYFVVEVWPAGIDSYLLNSSPRSWQA